MTALAKNVQTHTTSLVKDSLSKESISPFQDTFRFAYSHGLESIYSIETIDLKSIRKLNVLQPADGELQKIALQEELFENQLNLDLGAAYRDWMPPFILQEPIQVLDLAKPIEKVLLEKGLCNLGLLSKVNFRDVGFLKGLGQGHIEEIKNKLKSYFADKPKRKTGFFDTLSLIKCLFGHLDRKKVYIALEPYGLHAWISLSPVEKVELKRLTPEVRCQWVEEIWKASLQGKNKKFLDEQIEMLVETWIRPWMRRRGGFAKREEIIEWLLLHTLDEKIGQKVLSLLENELVFKLYLPSHEDILSASEVLREKLQLILSKARSYFAKAKNWYYLEELSGYLHAELAREWINVDPNEIHLALRLSNDFELVREASGHWSIRLTKMRLFSKDMHHTPHREALFEDYNSSMSA